MCPPTFVRLHVIIVSGEQRGILGIMRMMLTGRGSAVRVGMSSMGLLVLIGFVGVVAINHMGGNVMM